MYYSTVLRFCKPIHTEKFKMYLYFWEKVCYNNG